MARTAVWLSSAWQAVTADLFMSALLALIFALVLGFVGGISDGALVVFVLGPMYAGALAVALHHLRTGRLDLNRLQDGLQAFLPSMLIGLLVCLLAAIGWVLLFVPGLIVLAFYTFSLLLAIDRKMGFWDAMEESRKKVKDDLVGFIGFVLALMGVNLLGVLCFGIGLLVSLPVTWWATAAAYRELWAEETALAAAPSPCRPACDCP